MIPHCYDGDDDDECQVIIMIQWERRQRLYPLQDIIHTIVWGPGPCSCLKKFETNNFVNCVNNHMTGVMLLLREINDITE